MIVTTTTGVTKLVWKIGANGLIEFGSRGQLRKILNITSTSLQAYHIMPWGKSANQVIQRAAKSAGKFHMNSALNGIAVAAWRNQPNHFAYDNRIISKLNDILATNPNPQQAYDQLEALINNIKTAINNNPNTHLNDLIF